MTKSLLRAIVALLLAAGAAWAGPFEDGLAAYQRADFAAAIKSYRVAAANGSAQAEMKLGAMYAVGLGVIRDEGEAFRWYGLAAAQGYADAQTNIGLRYATGQGVTLNYLEAVRWLRLAAKQDHPVAQFALGTLYASGEGVAQDFVRAYMWFDIGAASGDPDGTKNREGIAPLMATQQIADAQQMARECRQRNFEDCE
jgi:uncharacterized protein